MRACPLINQINFYKKVLRLGNIFALFTNKEHLIIFILFLITCNQSIAENMVCVLHTHNPKKQLEAVTYVQPVESETIILLDTANKITKFSSPGCHKTQTVAFWTNSIEINCNSNAGEKVNLQINLSDLKFNKTYLKNSKKIRSLFGFCVVRNN